MNADVTTYDGQLGIVLFLDESTEHRAIQIATKYKNGNSIDLGGLHTPHVTLYHSKLGGLPNNVVDRLLDIIIAMLPTSLTFTQVSQFGGKFLFWDIERSEVLLEAHNCALELSKYFVRIGEQQPDKEKINLSVLESANVKTFGHPFVRDLWRPHVTIGYYSDGAPQEIRTEGFSGRAVGVAFVRVGEAGTIKEIITQRTL